MPGKQARGLCPGCAEPIPPDETECWNCGAFVIDEAVVRLSRAFGLDREKALKLFEAGFRHPKQLRDRDPNRVLEKGEVRSEERRVGKECRSEWWPEHERKKRKW